jgi:cobalt-zinc-cadmium efflux system outer membrane protein
MGQPSPPSLSIDDAVRLAIRQNPRVSAAAREVVAARAGVRSARALANPDLVFTPAITPGGSDEELLLSQPLELNGTRSARTGIASAQLRQAQAEATVELRSLVFDTKTAYQDLARARERQALALEVLQIAEEFDRITRRQVEIGTRPGIDQTQTEIEVVRARQTGFQAGLTSTVAVLEAQRTYRAVLSDYTDPLVAHAKARAELERATGAFPANLLPPLAKDAGTSR